MDPLEGGELNVFETTPGPASSTKMNYYRSQEGSLEMARLN